MRSNDFQFPRVGVIGGGQLARMMLPAARRLGIRLVVLDPTENAPAAAGADLFLQGDLYDEKALRRLSELVDFLTFEIEHTSTEVLAVLESEGTVIRPSATVLRSIQDKLTQKQLLSHAGLPVPRFATVPEPERLDPVAQGFAYPCVWKTRFGGYDGRGVRMLRNASDCEELRCGCGCGCGCGDICYGFCHGCGNAGRSGGYRGRVCGACCSRPYR